MHILEKQTKNSWTVIQDVLWGKSFNFDKLVEFLESENRIRLNPVFGKAALN